MAVSVPRLELDRPFTYRVPAGAAVATGFLVSVPFHGRTVRGWVLGPTDDVPDRVLEVRRVLSRVPLFDERALRLYRWMSERYVVPLAAVIDRAHPPRVAGIEVMDIPEPAGLPETTPPAVLSAYEHGERMRQACASGEGAYLLRPLPDDEAVACVEAVAACVAGGRDAIVVVPEADPLPHTAGAVAAAFGEAAVIFAGGEPRRRYRTWLDILAGRYRVVVGTRPAVFAPVRRLGLVWVNRDAHPGHREERAPYHHARDVALARSRLEEATCVIAAHCPSAEAAAAAHAGELVTVRAPRARERAASPLVEVVGGDERVRPPRLVAALRRARGAVLLVTRAGFGVARVCRDCGDPARCGVCGGTVEIRRGAAGCAVCGSAAACARCGGTRFGVDPRGAEHVRSWAASSTDLPTTLVEEGARAEPPGRGSVLVGTAAAVKDFGPRRVDLVGIMDADRALRRAGLSAPEQVLATWMEAGAWAGPRAGGGRVLVQTRESGDPAIQALIRWDPSHFHGVERSRRQAAGFPPGFPVFRVRGRPPLAGALGGLAPVGLLVSSLGDETVCLVTLRPGDLAAFRERVIELLHEGVATRVEAEPQL